MSPSEQRIKLAEWAGLKKGQFVWSFRYWTPTDDDTKTSRLYTSSSEANDAAHKYTAEGYQVSGCCGRPLYELPDFLNDLNAVRSVEEKLNDEQQDEYAYQLSQLIPQKMNCGPVDDSGVDVMVHREFDLLHASAAQRCEALIRTLGL